MINANQLLNDLKNEITREATIGQIKQLKQSDLNDLLTLAKSQGKFNELYTLLTGIKPPEYPPQPKKEEIKPTPPKEVKKQTDYGIYTVSDYNFFPGTVATINSLRYHDYTGPLAIIDIGFEDWMKRYLTAYQGISILDISQLRQSIRFTDVLTTDQPVMTGWAYKVFGMLHYNLFPKWTFIDADYLPFCNLEQELLPLINQGHFISTEDGTNTWTEQHKEAIGVAPGSYMNINAGFISLDMNKYNYIIHEWRNLMTRKKPFELWYGDQGALNAILDKYHIPKYTVEKTYWNQTWMNKKMAEDNLIVWEGNGLIHRETKKRVYGWHGTGWHKLWHQLGIDHFRKDEKDREKFRLESEGKSPKAVVECFEKLLFMDKYNKKLKRSGHLLYA